MEPFANEQTVGPFARLAWEAILAISQWMSADNSSALATVERGLALAGETGAHLWDFMLAGQGVFAAATSGDPDVADAYLRRMDASVSRERRLDGVHYHFACFHEATRRDDRNAMREHANAGLACAIEAGVPWGEVYTRPALAHSLFLDGDAKGARRELAATMRIARQIGCTNARYYVHELEAQFAGAQGDADAELVAVRSLFRVMREQGFVNSAWWRSGPMARLCLIALEHDVEADHVRRLIRLRALRPDGPAARLESWPWPLRIRTFGRFEIEVDGEPLRFTGKVQKRPLELLRTLVAFGGTAVHEAQLAQALWPDAEGDDAHNAFVTTLQRLRRMLVHRDALRLQEGKLSRPTAVPRRHLGVRIGRSRGGRPGGSPTRHLALSRRVPRRRRSGLGDRLPGRRAAGRRHCRSVLSTADDTAGAPGPARRGAGHVPAMSPGPRLVASAASVAVDRGAAEGAFRRELGPRDVDRRYDGREYRHRRADGDRRPLHRTVQAERDDEKERRELEPAQECGPTIAAHALEFRREVAPLACLTSEFGEPNGVPARQRVRPSGLDDIEQDHRREPGQGDERPAVVRDDQSDARGEQRHRAGKQHAALPPLRALERPVELHRRERTARALVGVEPAQDARTQGERAADVHEQQRRVQHHGRIPAGRCSVLAASVGVEIPRLQRARWK